jgi:hypothetical protein
VRYFFAKNCFLHNNLCNLNQRGQLRSVSCLSWCDNCKLLKIVIKTSNAVTFENHFEQMRSQMRSWTGPLNIFCGIESYNFDNCSLNGVKKHKKMLFKNLLLRAQRSILLIRILNLVLPLCVFKPIRIRSIPHKNRTVISSKLKCPV